MKYEDIKTYAERCNSHPDHQTGIITNQMITDRLLDEIEELRAYVEQSLKPVAWIFTWYEIAKDRHVRRIIDCEEKPNIPGYDLVPLYTSPPQSKPLTDEEIAAILSQSAGVDLKLNGGDLLFARAIERAHGIGGEK
jgi:hypothetical protein